MNPSGRRGATGQGGPVSGQRTHHENGGAAGDTDGGALAGYGSSNPSAAQLGTTKPAAAQTLGARKEPAHDCEDAGGKRKHRAKINSGSTDEEESRSATLVLLRIKPAKMKTGPGGAVTRRRHRSSDHPSARRADRQTAARWSKELGHGRRTAGGRHKMKPAVREGEP
jgi:hypothetical protein